MGESAQSYVGSTTVFPDEEENQDENSFPLKFLNENRCEEEMHQQHAANGPYIEFRAKKFV
jgi:hypothetical protein